ncbi:MAG: Gfo/Idh/MocA family oxidoreductase [Steroidobacteraceae bacterium]
MTRARIGLIGTGFIGRTHAIALSAVGAVFADIEAPVRELLADTTEAAARAAAGALGFARATGDWRELVADPAVNVVDICTPNHLHRDMALAAIGAGKHVWCEKPLANTAREAREIAAAADAAGVRHLMGFNYICNPLLQVARDMIAAGELGDVYAFRGSYLEDYMSDPAVPWSWRCDRALAGSGALADLGSHLINLGHFLLGAVARVNGRLQVVHRTRRDPATGATRAVENEDIARALIEFANGVPGTFEVSRVATGLKCGLAFAVFGTRGALEFDQERMNELRWYDAAAGGARRGFRTLLAGPEHPDYRPFCPAPGHGLGYNDLKVIEARNLLRAVAGGAPAWPDFHEGARVQAVMEAIEASHASGAWTDVGA